MMGLTHKLKPLHFVQFLKCYRLQLRSVAVLHISGDKASENYAPLQPYIDFTGTFGNLEALDLSIQRREIQTDLNLVKKLYEEYTQALKGIEKVEEEREMVATQLKELSKSKKINEDLKKELIARGRDLRNNVKSLKTNFYPIENDFMQNYLDLPNLLHPQCPEGKFERIIYRSKQPEGKDGKSHLSYDYFIKFIDNTRYYMKKEAAKFDIFATDALTTYIRNKGDFIQTSNPDFVRRVLLEANATPIENYHKVMETHLQNSINCAFLTGGASFESYLGAVTKLCVFPSVIPLKYVCTGRLYERTLDDHIPSLYTATQTNAVQTFVASKNQQQAEEQMDAILNLCVDFYKCFANLHFRIVYVKPSELTASECLRAQIEVYSPAEKRYICVGRVSNFSDFVSKRILFTIREQKNYNFPHLVGGPVLFTSRLIAALIECEEKLDYEKVCKALKLNTTDEGAGQASAVDEFKALFK